MLKVYPHVKNSDGSYTIKGVDIFALGVDERTKKLNEKWFDDIALKQFQEERKNGFLPIAHVGHTKDDPEHDKERPRVAFMDNLRREGKMVKVDLTGIPETVFNELKDDPFPNRSVELKKKNRGFRSLALLSSTEPHFKLPNSLKPSYEQFAEAADDEPGDTFEQKFEGEEDLTLSQIVDQHKAERQLDELNWAFWDKLYAIKESDKFSMDEKRTKLHELVDEWAGLAKAATDSIADSSKMSEQQKEFEKFRTQKLAELNSRETKLLEQDLESRGLCPAVLKNFSALRNVLANGETVIRFKSGNAEKEMEITPVEAFDRFMKDLALRAAKGTLYAPTKLQEITDRHEDLNYHDDPADGPKDDGTEEDKAIKKFMADNKITNYADGRRRFLNSDDGEKFRQSKKTN